MGAVQKDSFEGNSVNGTHRLSFNFCSWSDQLTNETVDALHTDYAQRMIAKALSCLHKADPCCLCRDQGMGS